ncbi:stAR-related lipid transfer protein 5 isoform X2 [Hippopotamus amphibius kiboko]|uniref:stAR-related lipid transfer protein 5 isoform X2 n=1 Tax=Hippopotamus amphibius kiboko TaxID=575201 RepID=UPI002593477B|nr:stAR-related lipid transfer protein 5 isoform X2 [Hippopotamus amphibius kiboko]
MDPALAAQISEAVAEKMLQYRRDKSGWKICREGEGVSISCRPSVEFPGNLYRGEGIVNGTPAQVWDCVKPLAGTLRDKWDENVNSFEIIESITDTLCVSRTATPSAVMKLISPRDFVDLVLVKTYEDGTISSNGSLTRPAWSRSSRPTSAVTSHRAWWTPSSPAAWLGFTPTSRKQ